MRKVNPSYDPHCPQKQGYRVALRSYWPIAQPFYALRRQRGKQGANWLMRSRMDPKWCNFCQRFEHKAAAMGARVW
jgi:hypothetical protein